MYETLCLRRRRFLQTAIHLCERLGFVFGGKDVNVGHQKKATERKTPEVSY